MATIAENIQTLRSIKSDIKNAIIQKGGSVTDAFGGYAQAITDLPSGGGGGTEMEDALVMRTISEYSNDRVSMVSQYTFYHYSNLKSIELSNCMYIYGSAFYNCSKLVSVNLPLCRYISENAFTLCYSLTSIELPNCLSVSNYVFHGCSRLTLVSLPKVMYLGFSTFYSCSRLTQVYLNSVSSVTSIKSTTFSGCPKLTYVHVPSSLVNAFRTAQYWSSISNKIVAYGEVATGPDFEIGGGPSEGGPSEGPIID